MNLNQAYASKLVLVFNWLVSIFGWSIANTRCMFAHRHVIVYVATFFTAGGVSQGLGELGKHKSRLEKEKEAAAAVRKATGASPPVGGKLPSYMRPTSASKAMQKVGRDQQTASLHCASLLILLLLSKAWTTRWMFKRETWSCAIEEQNGKI